MDQDFHRTRRLPPYVFAEVNRLKAKARASGEDIIDFGMGNPDQPTPKHIVDKMVEAIQDPRTHRYSNSRGIPGLRRAQAAYYQRRFGVELDPETEVIATLGSKEGIANLAQAITSPGDIILVPNPSYPIHPYGFIIAGAAIRHIPVGDGSDFMAGLERAVRHSVPKPLALVLNYPSNPTAEVVGLDFYEKAVGFARKHGIYIISDVAYSEIYFGDEPPPSILQIPGAKDVAIEFSSMSKTYSMPGWRVGFGVGNKKLIDALARIKSYVDYGAFTPIQVAATAALNGPQDFLKERNDAFKSRRDLVVSMLNQVNGFHCPTPEGAFYVYPDVSGVIGKTTPQGKKIANDADLIDYLLDEGRVAAVNGGAFGLEPAFRISYATSETLLTEACTRIQTAVNELR